MSMITDDNERVTWREMQRQMQIGRALIMILVALAIFAGSLYLVYGRADNAQPFWVDEISDGR